jgi:dihydrodipicolinate synthase/N-acetylneuraminate lyase
VCGLSNLYPDVLRRLYDATTDRERRNELAFLRELLAALKPHSPMPAMKAIRAMLSGDRRWLHVMPPLVALDEQSQAWLKTSIAAFSAGQPVAA